MVELAVKGDAFDFAQKLKNLKVLKQMAHDQVKVDIIGKDNKVYMVLSSGRLAEQIQNLETAFANASTKE
jgi:hypothetical protein